MIDHRWRWDDYLAMVVIAFTVTLALAFIFSITTPNEKIVYQDRYIKSAEAIASPPSCQLDIITIPFTYPVQKLRYGKVPSTLH